jgi:hypothetical protein
MENSRPRNPQFPDLDPNFAQNSAFSSRNAGCARIALPKVCGRNGTARHPTAQPNIKQKYARIPGGISFT